MNASAPFFVAAASQILGVGVQRIVDLIAAGDYDRIGRDPNAATYNIPPKLEKDALSRRWNRDSDALLAVLFAISIVATSLDEFRTNETFVFVVSGTGIILPMLALAVMLSVHPDTYYKRTIFKSAFPISPFAYVATTAGLAVGFAVLIFG